ncbi:MAG: hypothetical protein ACTTIM_02645 [Campylobacter sp.]
MENNTKLQVDFDNAKNELEICQNSHGFTSCFNCEKLLDCAIRDAYVETPTRCFQKAKTATLIFKFLKEKDEKIYNNTDLLCK